MVVVVEKKDVWSSRISTLVLLTLLRILNTFGNVRLLGIPILVPVATVTGLLTGVVCTKGQICCQFIFNACYKDRPSTSR